MRFLIHRILQLELHLQFKIGGSQTDSIVVPLADQHKGAEGQGCREHIAAIVVRVLADQVNPSGCEENPDVCSGSAVQTDKLLFQLLHICHWMIILFL
ncbi:hypothetical protein D3C76_1298350 [compost metagenome]